MRLLFVANGPLPYHTPILNNVAGRSELHVVYMSRSHPFNSFSNLWGVEPEFAHSFYGSVAVKLPRLDFRTQLSAGVSRLVRRLDPDVVFFSSWGPLVWEPVLWARRAGRGTVMWAESTATSGLARGPLSTRFRRTIAGSVDSFVSNGTLATEYLHALGVPESRIVTSRLPSSLAVTTSRSDELPAPAFLFVGRLTAVKRPGDALSAFKQVAAQLPQATLSFVGDGPLEPKLRSEARNLGGRVRFRGRLEGEQLAVAYAEADILVLPSARDVWGLVVNEALASGLLVIASTGVGSAHDLLNAGTGAIVPVGDIPALVDAMHRAADGDHGPDARSARARSVAEVTPQRFAEDIVRAAEHALRKP